MKKFTFVLMTVTALVCMVFATSCLKDASGGDDTSDPVISITTQPSAPSSTLTEGSVAGTLIVAASVNSDVTLRYQWYGNSSSSNKGGTSIDDATFSRYTLPTDLTAGTYYYFCEISATGAKSVRTNPVTVVVRPVDGPEPPPSGPSTETTAEFDNASFGLYKGVLAGSSGTIRIEINNGDNIAQAVIVMDGATDVLTSSSVFTSGQAVSGAQFTGAFSSFTFSVDADGSNPTIVSITIDGHDSVVAIVNKEKSDDVSLCYEGTSTGGNDHSGVFNIVRNNNTFSGVSKGSDGFTFSLRGTVAADGSFTGSGRTTFNGLDVLCTYSGSFGNNTVSGTWTTSWNAGGSPQSNNGTFSGSTSSLVDEAHTLIAAHPWKVVNAYDFYPEDWDDPDTAEDERYLYLTEDIGLIYTFHADGTLSVPYLINGASATWEVNGSVLTLHVIDEDGNSNMLKHNITKLTETEFNCTGVLQGTWEDDNGNSGTYPYSSTIQFVKP